MERSRQSLMPLLFDVALQNGDVDCPTTGDEVGRVPQDRLVIEVINPLGVLSSDASTGYRLQVGNEFGQFQLGVILKQDMQMIRFTVDLYQFAVPFFA